METIRCPYCECKVLMSDVEDDDGACPECGAPLLGSLFSDDFADDEGNDADGELDLDMDADLPMGVADDDDVGEDEEEDEDEDQDE